MSRKELWGGVGNTRTVAVALLIKTAACLCGYHFAKYQKIPLASLCAEKPHTTDTHALCHLLEKHDFNQVSRMMTDAVAALPRGFAFPRSRRPPSLQPEN